MRIFGSIYFVEAVWGFAVEGRMWGLKMRSDSFFMFAASFLLIICGASTTRPLFCLFGKDFRSDLVMRVSGEIFELFLSCLESFSSIPTPIGRSPPLVIGDFSTFINCFVPRRGLLGDTWRVLDRLLKHPIRLSWLRYLLKIAFAFASIRTVRFLSKFCASAAIPVRYTVWYVCFLTLCCRVKKRLFLSAVVSESLQDLASF